MCQQQLLSPQLLCRLFALVGVPYPVSSAAVAMVFQPCMADTDWCRPCLSQRGADDMLKPAPTYVLGVQLLTGAVCCPYMYFVGCLGCMLPVCIAKQLRRNRCNPAV